MIILDINGRKVLHILFLLAFIIIGQIWFKGIQSIATYLGLLSAGIAIALKDPLTNITGWLYIFGKTHLKLGKNSAWRPNW